MPSSAADDRTPLVDAALELIPDEVFGVGEWASDAVRALVEPFAAAVESGQSYRVANAIRSLAHVPTRAEIRAVVDAVLRAVERDDVRCGAAAADRVERLRTVAADTLAELPGEPRSPARTAASDLVETLLAFVHVGDPARADHLRSVGRLSMRLAIRLGLDAKTVRRAWMAGALHDVAGAASARFLWSVAGLREIAPLVRAHGERYGGGGLPDGLAGAAIPIEARIAATADRFHGIATEAGVRAALAGVEAGAGSDFDPAVCAALADLLSVKRQAGNRSA